MRALGQKMTAAAVVTGKINGIHIIQGVGKIETSVIDSLNTLFKCSPACFRFFRQVLYSKVCTLLLKKLKYCDNKYLFHEIV